MNSANKLKVSVVGSLLLSMAFTASALTLGRPNGGVFVGKPLDLSVPVQAESQEHVSSACFDAEVFYGEMRQDASRISLTVVPASAGQATSVRIRSSASIDEPVVTVQLRATCGNKALRRYVVLADVSTDLTPQSSVNPILASSIDTASEIASSKGKRRAEVPVIADSLELKPARSTSPRKNEKTASKPVSLLKLAPLDLSIDRDLALKLTPELLVIDSVEDLQKRAQAVATWKALNATPDDILRNESLLQALELERNALQTDKDKGKQAISDYALKLEKAESERYANPLVYGLATALVVCLIGVSFVVVRYREQRSTPTLWRGDGVRPVSESLEPASIASDRNNLSDDSLSELGEIQGATKIKKAAVASAGRRSTSVDIELDIDANASPSLEDGSAVSTKDTASVADSVDSTSGSSEFLPSAYVTLGAANTQEMVDVRQQAEFFMTLGHYDEAIAVLENSISDNGSANPLVYLDLLKVFHALSRKPEYDRCRAEFNTTFTGHVPAYEQFTQGGNALEAYPEICQRIVTLWQSSEVLDYIEKCMVRTPGADLTRGFDLEAFRELLMLHSVARRHISSAPVPESGLMPFRTVPRQPATQHPAPYLDAKPSVVETVTSEVVIAEPEKENPELDLDLSDDSKRNLIDFDVSGFSGAVPLSKS
jgi:pilus assembly protein FimV